MQWCYKIFAILAFVACGLWASSSRSQVIIETPNTIPNGSFENAVGPAYWHKADVGDATVEWSNDQVRSPQRSLKISDAGGDAPMWESDNLAKLNWNPVTGTTKNIEMEIGGWVKTENVSANPANASGEIQLIYSFYDRNKNLIFGQPVVIKVPQTQASIDWTAMLYSAIATPIRESAIP